MVVTKARVIYGDVVLAIALLAFYFLTEHLTQNVLAMSLIILLSWPEHFLAHQLVQDNR
ncbi:MAG: hypothetical protein JO080_02885 [Mucilaginibacter sp.]|nr:hypothetical protein [Mucilaginibacter sp.]